MKKFTLLFALLLGSVSAEAHTRFTLNGPTPPRNDSTGLKSGPCGGIARTNSPAMLVAGQKFTVYWQETVNHPGYYTIAFSPANDQNFAQNVLATVQDVAGQSQYSAEITVPSTPCTGCTLQLIQYMTENPNNPSLYFSCADIEIKPAGTPVPSPSPVPSMSPTPAPSGNCH